MGEVTLPSDTYQGQIEDKKGELERGIAKRGREDTARQRTQMEGDWRGWCTLNKGRPIKNGEHNQNLNNLCSPFIFAGTW